MDTIDLSNHIKVTFSENATDQVKYLLNRISEVEWSGILFYTIQGSIKSPKDFSVNVEYIYLMDKGSSAYTSFEVDESIVGFMMDNPEAMEWRRGLIHSHNKMDVFFSGTDISELKDGSKYNNYYLSIVVNNRMDVVGKIVFKGTRKVTNNFTCKDEDGKLYSKPIVTESEALLVYNCDIEFAKTVPVKSPFNDRVEEIIRKKMIPAKTETKNNKFKGNQFGNQFGNPLGFGMDDDEFTYPTRRNLLVMNNKHDYDNDNDDIIDDTDIEDFASFWLSFGDLGSENFALESCIYELVVELDDYTKRSNFMTALLDNSVQIYLRMFAGRDDGSQLIKVFKGVSKLIKETPNVGENTKDRVNWQNFVNFVCTNLNNYIDKLEREEKKGVTK